jgi:hypothetical protein
MGFAATKRIWGIRDDMRQLEASDLAERFLIGQCVSDAFASGAGRPKPIRKRKR